MLDVVDDGLRAQRLVAGGMVPVGDGVLYQRWLVGRVVRYDNVQHAWGFGFAGRAVWESLRPRLGTSRAAAVAIVVLGGTGLGALNEVAEYALTKLLPETNVGGYENTARDLVANLVGATTAAVLTARRP
jgi:putative membrane protein